MKIGFLKKIIIELFLILPFYLSNINYRYGVRVYSNYNFNRKTTKTLGICLQWRTETVSAESVFPGDHLPIKAEYYKYKYVEQTAHAVTAVQQEVEKYGNRRRVMRRPNQKPQDHNEKTTSTELSVHSFSLFAQ